MKTYNIIKSALMCGLLLTAPLTLSAAITENTGTNIAITAGSGTAQSDVVFDNAGNTTSPLNVSTTGWYSGTRVIVTATTTAANNGRTGVTIATSGTVNLTDSAITANLYGLTASGTSTVILNNTNITTNSIVANSYGINLSTASVLTMNGGTITTGTGNTSYGLNLSGTSVAQLNNVSIITHANGAAGLSLTTSSTASFSGTIVTHGTTAHGFYVTGSSALTLGDNVSITTNGDGSGIYVNGTGSRLAAGNHLFINSGGIGINVSAGAAVTAPLNNVDITTRNTSAHGIQYISGIAPLTLSGGTIHTLGDSARGLSLTGTSAAMLDNVTIITEGDAAYGLNMGTSSTLTITGGTIHTTGSTAHGLNISGTSTATLNNVNFITEGTSAHVINAMASSTLVITGGTIAANGYSGAYGVYTSGSSFAVMNDIVVTVSGTGSALRNVSATMIVTNGTLSGYYGLYTAGTSTTTLNDTAIITSGSRAIGIAADGGNITFNRGSIQTSGTRSYGVYFGNPADGHVILNNVNITTSDELADGLFFSTLQNNPHYIFEMDGGSINAQNAVAIDILQRENRIWNETTALTYSGSYDLSIKNADVRGRDGSLMVGNIWSATNAAGDLVEVAIPTLATVVVESSTFTGAASFEGSATTVVSFSNNSVLNGDLIASGTSITTLTLNNSVLTGKSEVADTATLTVILDNNANWNMTGRSWVTNLHGASGGTITIDNVQGEDLIVKGSGGNSGITGETKLNLTLSDSVKGDQEIWVVVDESNKMSGERFKLGNEVSYGMYQYELVNASDGAWLVYTGSSGTTPPVNPPPVDPLDPTDPPVVPPVVPPVPSGPPIISNEGDTILNTAAAVAGFWFTQLDNLHKRMGELRYNKLPSGDLIDNVWVRSYGQQINANTGIYSVKGFTETQYGVDLGTDHAWTLDKDNIVYTGVFAGYGGADRDFHTSYKGSTDSGYGGVYGTWINNDGWYADVVAKGQYFKNDFTGEDKGSYDSIGAGISLEVGNMFEFKDGWFVEPSAQVSYLHLMNDNYTTRDGLHVDLTDADVLHIYGGARFGRNIKLTNSGRLQPYIKAGGLGQISSGNKVTVSGDHWRPNLDGARAVVGAGVVWQLDADNQLHLDYEASFGDKYDKPWGLNFGYRHQF